MSAPSPRLAAGDQPAAEALTDVFKAIEPAELDKHEAVLAYWLSIRGNRELPPLRDLDPLEISGAASNSVLLELIGGGEDAEIRHVGEQLKSGGEVERIGSAPRPSILASIARKLSIVAISRNFLAFEDEFSTNGSTTRCWVTLLPLSAAGAWVDYVYAYVTFETEAGETAKKVKEEAVVEEPQAEAAAPEAKDVLDLQPEAEEIVEESVETVGENFEPAAEAVEAEDEVTPVEEAVTEAPEPAAGPAKKAGFSFDALASAVGFYGRQAVKVEPVMPTTAKAKAKAEPEQEEVAPALEEEVEPVEELAESAEELVAPEAEEVAPVADDILDLTAEDEAVSFQAEEAPPPQEVAVEAPEEFEPAAEHEPHQPSKASEGTLQSKLTEVRAKADEARAAKLRANAALYDGLSAAYDFALDAEDAPEEYLRIVEGAGLKIQLRAPMRPVVKLAFDGMCDDSTIAQLEAVLAWAIDQDLPRGTLGQKIEEAGGIGPILTGMAKAA